MDPCPGPPNCLNSRKNGRNGCINSCENGLFYDGDATTGRVVAFSRFWRGDISENGLGDAGSEGRGVLGVSDLTIRENLAGEDPQDLRPEV